MRITDTDRELAREVGEMLDCTDERTIKALAIVLWSHRQRPADSEPNVRCGAVNPATMRTCVLPAGHEDEPSTRQHRVADGRWFS